MALNFLYITKALICIITNIQSNKVSPIQYLGRSSSVFIYFFCAEKIFLPHLYNNNLAMEFSRIFTYGVYTPALAKILENSIANLLYTMESAPKRSGEIVKYIAAE